MLYLSAVKMEMNSVFVTNSNFLILISLELDGVNILLVF